MKIYFIFSIFFFVILLKIDLFSFDKDTTRKTTSEVFVTAGRLTPKSYENYNPSYFIGDTLLSKLNISQVGEALNLNPGIFIRDYGGAGGLKTISIRGTTSSQSKIFLNGIDLNSSQNSSFDLSLIPESIINSIETVRGGLSVIHGSNSMGGIVNIITNYTPNIEGKLSYSSYNDIVANIKIPLHLYDNNLITHLSYCQADGNYPFTSNQFGENIEFKRTNSAFKQLNLSMSTVKEFSNSELSLFLLNNFSERGVPGSVIQGRVENTLAELNEAKLFGILSLNNTYDKSKWDNSISVKLGYTLFSDPYQIGLNGQKLRSSFYSNDYKFISKLNIESSFNHNFLLDVGLSNLKGEFLDSDDNYVGRYNFSLAYNLDKFFHLFNDKDLSFFSGIRLDYFSDNDLGISPAFGLNYFIEVIKSNLQINISSNFRVPGFNELYYLNYGTKDLLPENSITANLTLNTKYFDFISLSVSTFFINTQNLIQSIPISPVRWSAQNIGKSINYGFEIFADLYIIPEYFKIIINYTLQNPIDKTENSHFYDKIIAYQPLEMLNSYLFLNLGNFDFNINSQYTSYRFALQSNDLNSILDNYLILNLGTSYNFDVYDINLTFQFNVKNVFDKNYAIIMNYPMPGRTYKFSIIYRLLE